MSIHLRLALMSPRRREQKPVNKVLTVRLPEELHKELKELAAAHRISLNGLCLVALEEARSELASPAPSEVPE